MAFNKTVVESWFLDDYYADIFIRPALPDSKNWIGSFCGMYHNKACAYHFAGLFKSLLSRTQVFFP